MTVLERIQKIGEMWFLTEPLLFSVYCSHDIVENDSMDVFIRTGNRKIEFSPSLLKNVQDSVLAELLKIEIFRILLKHPYQRQPPFADKELLTRSLGRISVPMWPFNLSVRLLIAVLVGRYPAN